MKKFTYCLALVLFAIGTMLTVHSVASARTLKPSARIVYPLGCTAATAYSAATGLPCSAPSTSSLISFPAGCTSPIGYSRTTGQPCSGTAPTVTYPAGCTSSIGYSWTTGQSCSAPSTPVQTPPLTYPSSMILVMNPNNNNTYYPGQTIPVQWTSVNVPASTLLEVNFTNTNGSMFGFMEPNGTPNDGYDTITIPADTPPGNNYQVEVGVPINSDFSNSNMNVSAKSIVFSIVANPNLPAGCTTTNGYSQTSGAACNGAPFQFPTNVPSTNPQASLISQLIAFPSPANEHTDLGCNGTRYSTTTGLICDGTENDVSSAFTHDATARIMEWYSKVNQHIDGNGTWQTDPDGTSGGQIDALTYCKKWFPNTTSVRPYKTETLSTWHEAGNVNNWRYTTTSEQCVQG